MLTTQKLNLLPLNVLSFFNDNYRSPFMQLIQEIDRREDWTVGYERTMEEPLEKLSSFLDSYGCLEVLDKPTNISLIRKILAYLNPSQRLRTIHHIGSENGLNAPDLVDEILQYEGDDDLEKACVGAINESLSLMQRESLLHEILSPERLDRIIAILNNRKKTS